jgi:hypothetical protein
VFKFLGSLTPGVGILSVTAITTKPESGLVVIAVTDSLTKTWLMNRSTAISDGLETLPPENTLIWATRSMGA